ncbi:UMP kinase, partial [Candidatus Gottesmanbacteria bacterium]|nr:UMP kinase [Candidatus Gottesmanbacteria bacterium]
MEKKEPIILSLGGSLIVPDGGINTEFLKKFNEFIRKHVAAGKRFFIVCGGGKIARHYRDAGKAVVGKELTADDLDWLAIHATRMNAHLLRTIFRDIAHRKIIDSYDKKYENLTEPVIIAAGWKPGWSTDYDAVLLGRDYSAKTIVNLSNIDMVYDKDPAKHKDATPIEKTSWEYFRGLVGDEWSPGLNTPFDPVASKLAQKLGLTVIILKGDNLDNLGKAFVGKKFVGTVITPLQLDASFYDREYFEGGKIGGYKGYTTSLAVQILRILRDIFRALKIKIFLRPKSL